MTLIPMVRRRALAAFIAAFAAVLGATLAGLAPPSFAQSDDKNTADWRLLTDGAIVLFRHASAPGVGDPAGFVLGDCATQRNLSDEGRDEARRIGERFRERQVKVGRVLTSRWCRARESARLAFPRPADTVRDEPLFDSFFSDRGRAEAQTRKARALLMQWKGPGVLVVFTHQVNITRLTDVFPASGEGVIVRPEGGRLDVVGRLAPSGFLSKK